MAPVSPYGEPCQATDRAGRSCIVREPYLTRHFRSHLVRRGDGSFYAWWTQDEEDHHD